MFNYAQLSQNVATYQHELQQRINRENAENLQQTRQDVINSNAITSTSSHIAFWATNNSWSYCLKCNTISSNILTYTFVNRPTNKHIHTCTCSNARYIVPKYDNIPAPLRGLSVDDLHVLRPFYLSCGQYQRHPKGYRMKTAMIRLQTSDESVENKIASLEDIAQQLRCRNACTHIL